MTPELAQTIALKALGWLVANEELCPVFLGASGLAAEELKARAAAPDLQASVLEFITMDDAWIIAFCDAEGLTYEQPLQARYALPGAEQVHWT